MLKPKVLYLTGWAHLYGDNRSLLGTLSHLKDKIDILVGVTATGPFTQELDRLGIKHTNVYGTMTPYITFNYIHYSPILKAKRLFSYWIHSIKAKRKLNEVIKDFRPDIIHTNNSNIYSGARLSKKYGIQHVWHIREYVDLDHDAQFPNKEFYDKNRVTSHCIAITKGLFTHFGMKADKDVQIYNGVCSEKDIRPYNPTKENYFLFLGRLVKTKGCEDMIEGFAQFSQYNSTYRLLIVGDGEAKYVNSLRELSTRLGIINKVDFLGFKKEIYTLLSKARALIVPSFFEAMGRITAEAMLAGCYVIGRATAGTKELLDNDMAGRQFSTIDELAEAMKSVADMPIEDLSKENKRVLVCASKRYTTENNARQIYYFHQKILTDKELD